MFFYLTHCTANRQLDDVMSCHVLGLLFTSMRSCSVKGAFDTSHAFLRKEIIDINQYDPNSHNKDDSECTTYPDLDMTPKYVFSSRLSLFPR